MTTAEMDEACRIAEEDKKACGQEDCPSCKLGRALLAAVGERDALRDLCAVLNSDGGHMQVADGAVAAVKAALDRWYALQARAVAAEQHAEALTAERDMLRVEIDDAAYTEAAAILRYQRAEKAITTERARVVEAIAAFVGAMSMRHRPWTFDEMAKAIRSHNWAAPEEES